MFAVSEKYKKTFRVVSKISSAVFGIVTFIGGLHSVVGDLSCVGDVKINIPSYIWVLLGFFVVSTSAFLLLRKKDVIVYPGRSEVPNKFINTNNRIEYISKKKLEMTVVGRTNISWFKDVEVKKRLYKKALKKGCVITFVIQHEFVENVDANDEDKINRRNSERVATLQAFEELYNYLKVEVGDLVDANFKLLFTKSSVSNSMTALHKGKNYVFFSYDIGLTVDNNPYVMFLNNSVIQELKDRFDACLTNCVDYFEYKSDCEAGKAEIVSLLEWYPEFSAQRKNDNKKLLYHYFKRREVRRRGRDEFYPPISVQLLVTNVCTTKCVMCDHHTVGKNDEFNDEELRNVVDYIYDIGTKNIIISGGEPLSRSGCIEFLGYVKGKGLNAGLLTNGVKKDGESLSAEDARRIKESCTWVQMSIDSFDSGIYKQIRNADLEIVRESAENLKKAGVNLEITFSVQKLNIAEAVDLVTAGVSPIKDVKVRFKFANGLNNKTGFLLTTGDKKKLREFVAGCEKSSCFNTSYIRSMFEKGIFTYDSVISGKPVALPAGSLIKKKDKCHVMNYTCKIAANGEVYPCCYLYDPNAGDASEIREKYSLGSLRLYATNLVRGLEGGKNELKELLVSEMRKNKENLLPVLPKACSCCTRHFYQNAFFNGLEGIVEKYENSDLRDESFWAGLDLDEICM